jgi:uncharacterized membrane protein YccC
MTEKALRTTLFAFRCTGAGTAALALATALGLEHPVWSAMSALIVSQERLDETKASVAFRILGTVIGIGTACAVNLLIARFGASLYLQLAIAVLFCAILVHRFPQLRVSMWTCALIIASSAATSITETGLNRGEEVILGTLVGGLFHAAAEAMLSMAANAGGRLDWRFSVGQPRAVNPGRSEDPPPPQD